jgi:Zn ribbon nucleic-acid-binding protein
MSELFLGCPKCKQIWKYDGYPSDPQVSSIQCLRCGYIGMGCTFPRMNKEKLLK